MGTTGTVRNTERTRRALLDAAAELLTQHGAGVTIADVATAAGVSKSGLLHHFPSRDALLLEVLRDAEGQLRELVRANLDLSENTPGKLLRAYVRTLCQGESTLPDLLGGFSFWAGLEGIPGADELEQEYRRWWNEQLVSDGMDQVLVRIIRRAAEGLAGARTYGDETPTSVHEAGDALIRLTFEPWPQN